MGEPFVERKVYENYGRTHTSDRNSRPTGPCAHGAGNYDSCNSEGYDLTEGYCSVHFVTNVLSKLEDILHEANFNWLATREAESHAAKSIWYCTCGYAGTYEERDKHFVAHDGDVGHQPPVRNTVVQNQREARSPRLRLTPKQATINPDDVG